MSGSSLTYAQSNYLDALRGGAAQLVLVGHIYSTSHPEQSLGIGDLGVIVFFILSGFLISYSALLKTRQGGGYGFDVFLRDRTFRIFVPYLPALIVVIGLDTLVFRYTEDTTWIEHYNFKDFIATLTMLQQHPVGLFADQLLGMEALKLATFGSARPWWTVANEWWLYASFGLIFFANQIAAGHFMRFLLLLTAVAMVPLFNMVAGTGQGLSLVWFIMAGFAWIYFVRGGEMQGRFAQWLQKDSKAKWTVLGALTLLAGLSFVRVVWISFIEPGFQYTRPEFYDFNLYVLLIIAFAILLVLFGNCRSSARQPVVRFLADYSYSLYLIHYSCIRALSAFGYLDDSSITSLITAYFLCNFVGIAAYLLFERHYKTLQHSYEAWRGIDGARNRVH